MHNTRRSMSALLLAGSLLFSLIPSSIRASYAQTPAIRTINSFDISGRFLQQWSNPGSDRDSYYVNGLPITPRRPEISLTDGKTYDTQWFERARYELHLENKPPYDVLLGALGVEYGSYRTTPVDFATHKPLKSTDPFAAVDQPDPSPETFWFPETRHVVAGKFLNTWNRFGGIQQFGFPISERFAEISPTDGQPYFVQYFERNRFELHPDNPDPYSVELGLLGVQLYRTAALATPTDQLPIAPPKGIVTAKDTYTEGSLQEPDSLFCHEATNLAALRYCSAITFGDSLVGLDDKDNYFPLAAWYVPTIENGGSFFVGTGDDRHLVTQYKLRPGLKWSDGADLTSIDAAFSYSLIYNDPSTADNSLQRRIASVALPDRYTILYNWMSLAQAKAIMADPKTDKVSFAFLQPSIDRKQPILDPRYVEIGTVHPLHALAGIPIDKLEDSPYAAAPIGYGPYMVQEWRRGDRLVLTRNPYYTLTDKPFIRQIVVQFRNNLSSRISAFLNGELDGIAGLGVTNQPEETAQIRTAGGIVDVVPGASWEHIDFYMGWGPFQDRNVRQAIIMGINRPQILDVAYHGAGAVLNTPVPSFIYHSLANPDFAREFPDLAARYKLPTYEYDPAKANAILDAAGWARGPDGIRAKGGQRLSFEYATTRNSTRQTIQSLVASDLKPLGIDAQAVNYPTGFFNEDGPIATGKCKFCQFAYTTTATSNFDPWENNQLATEQYIPTANRQHYRSRKVDEANRLFKTSADRHTIAEQSAIIQVEIMTDIAIVPLVQKPNIEIYSSKLHGRKTAPSTISQWWNISQWYFSDR